MAPPRRKGIEAERELANKLWDMGWAVIRGPASGAGARKRYQPDLVAALDGYIAVMEVKRGEAGKPLYLDPGQVVNLAEWARRAGGEAYIAVRLGGGEWRLHPVSSLKTTGRGRFKIERPEAGLQLRDLHEIVKGRHRRPCNSIS